MNHSLLKLLSVSILLSISSAAYAADSDGDGIQDGVDNCPSVANPSQANTDGDSFGNACDICPFDATNTCGAADNDNDGVHNSIDNCPAIANPGQEDFDGDNLGDACDSDDDNDGTPDTSDVCPLDATNSCAASDVDNDGVNDKVDECVSNPGTTGPSKSALKLTAMLVPNKGKLQIKLNFNPAVGTNILAINPNANGAHIRIADYSVSTEGSEIVDLDIPGVELTGADPNNWRCGEGDGWKAISPSKIGIETWTYTNASGLLPGDNGSGIYSCATPVSLLGMNPSAKSKFKLSIKNATIKKGYYQVKLSGSGLTFPSALSATGTVVKSTVTLGSHMANGSPANFVSEQASEGQCVEQTFNPQDVSKPLPLCKKTPKDATTDLNGLACKAL
jgi:hypothetical protein